MPEMHLRQLAFTYSACGPFTKKARIQKFKETGDSWYIYQKKPDKVYFQHGMAYVDFKDLTRRIASDKILFYKEFNIAKNPKHDGYQHWLASRVYKCFDKKTSGGATTRAIKSAIKNENISNKELAEKLRKPIIKKFKKRKVHSTFRDNICGADLPDMQLISNFNKEIRFLLCVIDISSKCSGFFLWKIKLFKKF